MTYLFELCFERLHSMHQMTVLDSESLVLFVDPSPAGWTTWKFGLDDVKKNRDIAGEKIERP